MNRKEHQSKLMILSYHIQTTFPSITSQLSLHSSFFAPLETVFKLAVCFFFLSSFYWSSVYFDWWKSTLNFVCFTFTFQFEKSIEVFSIHWRCFYSVFMMHRYDIKLWEIFFGRSTACSSKINVLIEFHHFMKKE